MPSHRRGRSLSEALTLERSDEGGLVVSSINSSASANQGLMEGDEILGATINFDQLSKEEVLKVLKLMEPFDDKVQVLTRKNLSKSLVNLDQCAKTPETMLKDSYSKLYNAKIRKFMRGDMLGAEEGGVHGEVTAQPTVPDSSKVNLKHDMGLPRLGVDFGLLKTKTLSTDVNADSQSDDTGELTYGSNLNLPPLGLGLNGTALSGAQLPRLKVDASGIQLPNTDPSVDLKMPNLERPQIGLTRAPEMGMDLKGSDISSPDMGMDFNGGHITGPSFDTGVPKVAIEGTNKEFKMPKFKMPNLDLSGPSFSGPECEVKTPDVGTPDVPSGKLSLKYSKKLKNPVLNVDNPSSYFESPKYELSGRSPDLDLEMQSVDVSTPHLHGPDIDRPSGAVKVPLKKSKISLKSPDLDMDDNIKGPSGKYKAPKFTMPKFDLPGIKVPGFNGDLAGPDVRLAASDLKAGIEDPNVDLNVPSTDFDIARPSGKLKMPGFGLSGSKVKIPEYELKTPDMDVSAPNFKGGINMPGVGLKDPKLDFHTPDVDLNTPKLNLDMPSGKLKMPELNAPDWDVNAPSGKLKLPKFNLSGTLPKGPNMDLNTDLKSPDLSLKAPKIKGGIDAPDLDLPDMDLKAPKLDVKTPDFNIDSPKAKFKMPKFKMPKFGLPSLKGPEIDGNFDGPDVDINAPKVNLKGPKADLDVDIAGPSGKLKKPNLNLPDLGFSGPKLDGPNLDFKSPDLDISGPNLSGGINAPDMNMPKVDLKSPKLDLNTPKLNLDMPSGKLKMPELHAPDWDVNAPSGKLKMPKFNLSGTLPKGPNADLKSPDFSLKAPKIKGGIDAPDLDLPNMGLKAPKLDVNTPDVNIGSPKAKFKMPKIKTPKVNLPNLKVPEIDGNFNSPDIDINAPNINLKGSKPGFEMPNVDFGSPSGKLKKPHLKMPDVGFSGPKLDGPNFDFKSPDLNAKLPKGPNLNINSGLKTPDLNLKAPKLKGGIDVPKLDLKAPKLDMNTPDVNLGFSDAKFKKPKIKMPNVDINGDLQGPDLDIPNVDVNGPKGKFKMPSLNVPDLSLSGPKAKTPDMNLSGPKLKGPGISMPDLDLPDARFKGPKLDLNAKHPDLGINGNIGRPDMNLTAPQVKGGIRGPDVDMNVPSGNLQGPQTDLDFADRKFKLPSFKLPQFGGQDLSGIGSDIDFGGSLRPTNLDFSPPNAKLNMKPPALKGNITGPKVSAPNMDLGMQKLAMQSPQLHLKSPDFNIDDPSLNFRGPSYKNRRSDITGVNMKVPVLDVDKDVRLRHTDRKSQRTRVRSSYPVMDAGLGHSNDLNRSDLNIDDFTGRNHVLRARGSTLDFQTSQNYTQAISPSGVNIDMRDPRHSRRTHPGDIDMYAKAQRAMQQAPNARLPHAQDQRIRVPDSTDGYYVTVFPDQAQNQRMPNRKHNTLGRLDFQPGNMNLEVPNENDLKGSTFFFSNLI